MYKDRDQFASLVREVAAPDVGRMGMEILSFTIKDVFDDVEYLASLGKVQTAAVKRDANIGVAQAERDAGIRVCGFNYYVDSFKSIVRDFNYIFTECLFISYRKCVKILGRSSVWFEGNGHFSKKCRPQISMFLGVSVQSSL